MPTTLTAANMTDEAWRRLSHAEREQIRDYSAITGHQLAELKGWRVEVVDMHGETRRFNVGQSTGWRPCLLEVKHVSSLGGSPVDSCYASVKPIRKVSP